MIKQQTKSEALNIAKPAGGDEILPLLEAVLDGRINKKTTVFSFVQVIHVDRLWRLHT